MFAHPSPRRARTSRTGVLVLLATLLAAFAFFGSHPQTASALCATDGRAGDWHAVNTATRSVNRVIVRQGCDDVRTCDQDGNCTGGTGSTLAIRPFGSCSPTACDWGSRNAQLLADGWARSTFDFGFKTSWVWVKTYQYFGLTYLRVYIYNDFTPADGRADYITDEWFLK